MKILWLDINSSYSHSSVALPAIHSQVADRADWEWCVLRGTINDKPGSIAAAVAEQQPDVIAATFWLFTHQMVIEVLSRAVQLLEGVKVICGGPEFLGDNELFLRQYHFITAVLSGEGEESMPKWLQNIDFPDEWSKIEGLCWIRESDGVYLDNGIAKIENYSALKYPEESRFFNWDKPFVQLETTRGCFNSCSFCVSGADKPIRYQSLSQVEQRLNNIYANGIRDVRVLDRTFNYDTKRASAMLDLFAKYQGDMRFHLEIHPSLLSEELKTKIASLPAGLLHLEAGIQSLDGDVLAQSGRKGSLDSSINGLKYLCSLDNIQVHADLIAGLPLYTLSMLYSDIVRLIEIGADELQIESLKVLPGTKFANLAIELGLKYSPLPPYEILKTPVISPKEIRMALSLSRVVDLYYNCHQWQKVFRTLVLSKNNFLFEFTQWLSQISVLDSPLSQERRGVLLYDYCNEYYPNQVADISIAWIEAGLSLKKGPAGEVHKVKSIESFLQEQEIQIEYGVAESTYRYYLFTSPHKRVLFGYDSLEHHLEPIFKAVVITE